MIDWISAVVPCAHLTEIRDGCFMKVDSKGEVQWSSAQRLKVTGSHESGVQIRSAQWEGDCTHLEISGNLTKFFQGHNLWGTDDLPGLVLEFMLSLATLPENPFSLLPSAEDVHAWRTGAYSLQRVDVTDSYTLRSRSDVLAWLRAAEQTAHLAHRGRGQLCKGSTLYFGKNSRRWSLKLYAKGQEIEEHLKDQLAIADLPHARAWADNVLRTELVIRSMELKRRGLGEGTAWLPLDGVPFESLPMLRDKLGAMTMTTNRTLSDDVIASLTAGQHSAYLAWVAGNDLRDVMSRPSFYRLRSKLLPHGVDIATLQPSEDRSNVVPLVRVLEAVPATIPDWARGTPLYFEPRRVA
jgi:II/X family phage/plasmid replication protein